jgi:flagellin-like hook-associated protein FlgL
MTVYGNLAGTAQARIGAGMNSVDLVLENLSSNILSFDARATEIEEADFAETAVGLADAQRALDANLQVAAQGRRTLFDFLG